MKLNKKGFTIVELVIVIAVIAILAAVLIPTFSTVIANANRSAALQEAKVAMDVVSMEENADLSGRYYIVTKDYEFIYDADGTTDTVNPDGKTGIINSKPKKFDSKATPAETQTSKIASRLTSNSTNNADTVYINDKATAPADTTNDTIVKNSDISKNAVVVKPGTAKE